MAKILDKLILREPKLSELKDLVPVYQQAFTKHNIFQRDPREILKYLQDWQERMLPKEGGFIVGVIDNKIVGGILLKKETQDLTGEHTRWKFNHLGVAKEVRGQGVGVALMNAAEEKIRKLILNKRFKTAKIEINVSESEKEILAFYKKFGFKIEGKLSSHYRWKDSVFVLGKEIGGFF